MTTKALTDPTGENGATGVIGHYTQVVWAETTDIGCGYIAKLDGQFIKSVSTIYTKVAIDIY